MSTGQQYRAKYDFKATAAGMLSFKCGEHFSLISKTNEGWWTVRSASGDSGLVPVNYVEPVEVRNVYTCTRGGRVSLIESCVVVGVFPQCFDSPEYSSTRGGGFG